MAVGEPLMMPSTSKDPQARAILAQLGARDALVAPMRAGGEVSGVLLVCDRLGDVSTFDTEDARLFATLANQAAIALENGHLIERLHDQVVAREYDAMHDALTDLPNRALLARGLHRLWPKTPGSASASCCWTSTGSRRSTTPSATRPATASCVRWPTGYV